LLVELILKSIDREITVIRHVCTETVQGPNEKRLFNELFGAARGYNRLERPVYNDSEALVVKFSLVLQQLINVVS